MAAIELDGIGQRCCNESTAIGIEVAGMTAEVFERHCLGAIDAVTHLDGVEIHFHDAMFRPESLDEDGEICLESLACPRRLGPQEYVLCRLLADGAGTSHSTLLFLFLQRLLNGIEIYKGDTVDNLQLKAIIYG